MPPPLTENWATAYFQIVVGLFIFCLTMPPLILQLVNEDLRQISRDRLAWKWWVVMIACLLIAAIIFVSWLHPPFPDAPAPAPNVAASGDARVVEHWAAVIVIVLLLVGVIICSYFIQVTFRRGKLVDALAEATSKKFRKEHERGRYNSSNNYALKDLIYLGQCGRPGLEKSRVLRALRQHITLVHAEEFGLYKGDELEAVIRGLSTILGRGDKVGSDENFELVIEILGHIRDGCFNRPLANTADARLVQRAIIELGTQAVTEASQEVALLFLKLAVQCDSNAVFEMGLAALAAKRYLVATIALRELEKIARDQSGAPLPVANLIGLLAHLTAGSAATNRLARLPLQRMNTYLPSPLKAHFEHSFERHYLVARFDTADHVAKLAATISY
jgi:hypothetical protein